MIRILGNSTERVEIIDLDDVVWYRQLKDYTDQEYEGSKDLKREIDKGRLVKIEVIKAPKGSVEVQQGQSTVNARDLKIALREVLPELKGNGIAEEIKEAVRDIAPLIVDMVRQEISKITVTGIAGQPSVVSPFRGPEYIPDIDTEGMIDSLKPKERKVSTDDMASSLAALRELQNKSK